MSMKKKTTEYQVIAKITLEIGFTVAGASLEETLANARKLDVTDVIEITTNYDHNDSSIEITGVFEA